MFPSPADAAKTPKSQRQAQVNPDSVKEVQVIPATVKVKRDSSLKRKASRSIPDEAEVTSKKTRTHKKNKNKKELIKSPRETYGMLIVLLQNFTHKHLLCIGTPCV